MWSEYIPVPTRPVAFTRPPNEERIQAFAAKKAMALAVEFSMGAALAMTSRPDCAEPMKRNTSA